VRVFATATNLAGSKPTTRKRVVHRTPSEIFDFSQSQNREIKKVPVETFLILSKPTHRSPVYNVAPTALCHTNMFAAAIVGDGVLDVPHPRYADG
jgi:hypothetical protein